MKSKYCLSVECMKSKHYLRVEAFARQLHKIGVKHGERMLGSPLNHWPDLQPHVKTAMIGMAAYIIRKYKLL